MKSHILRLVAAALAPAAAVGVLLVGLTGCAEDDFDRQAAFPEPIGYTTPPSQPPQAAQVQAAAQAGQSAAPSSPPPPPPAQIPPPPSAPADDEVADGQQPVQPAPGEDYADTDPSALTDFRGALESLRQLGRRSDVRHHLGALIVGRRRRLHAVPDRGPLDVRRRVHLGERLRLGLGAVPLRPLGLRRAVRLGLDPGARVRGRVGQLALRLRRLGLRRLGSHGSHLGMARRYGRRPRFRPRRALRVLRLGQPVRPARGAAHGRARAGRHGRRAHAPLCSREPDRERDRARRGPSDGQRPVAANAWNPGQRGRPRRLANRGVVQAWAYAHATTAPLSAPTSRRASDPTALRPGPADWPTAAANRRTSAASSGPASLAA